MRDLFDDLMARVERDPWSEFQADNSPVEEVEDEFPVFEDEDFPVE